MSQHGADARPMTGSAICGINQAKNPNVASFIRTTGLRVASHLHQHRLERSIQNKHDAHHTRLAQRQAVEEILMLQRALPVRPPHIALRETFGAREPLNARKLFRAFVDRSLRFLRSLVEFFAAGGPLS
jgi:hypothetical protein